MNRKHPRPRMRPLKYSLKELVKAGKMPGLKLKKWEEKE